MISFLFSFLFRIGSDKLNPQTIKIDNKRKKEINELKVIFFYVRALFTQCLLSSSDTDIYLEVERTS